MKTNLSVKSLEVLKLIAANDGVIGKKGFGREGRALKERELVKEIKGLYRITKVGRKYLTKIPF